MHSPREKGTEAYLLGVVKKKDESKITRVFIFVRGARNQRSRNGKGTGLKVLRREKGIRR